MKKILVIVLILLLTSCSWPFGKKSTTASTAPTKDPKGELVSDKGGPKPGDVELIDGVEWIYARNRKFAYTPGEPEYMWVRKDQYSPGVFESVANRISGQSPAARQEQVELKDRLSKLEADSNKGARPLSRRLIKYPILYKRAPPPSPRVLWVPFHRSLSLIPRQKCEGAFLYFR